MILNGVRRPMLGRFTTSIRMESSVSVRTAILTALFLTGTVRSASAQVDPEVLIQLSDYIAVDYRAAVKQGAVVSATEYSEMGEFAGRIVRLSGELGGPGAMLSSAERLAALIEAKAPGDDVAAASRAVRERVLAEHPVALMPATTPEAGRGAVIYRRSCASCHGPNGRGDGPLAQGLDPAPIDFEDRGRAIQQSLYGLYNTITLGVDGTSMPSFGELPAADRWAVAFYVGGLAATEADLATGAAVVDTADSLPLDTRTAVASTPEEVERELGPDAAALALYARRNPDVLGTAERSPLEVAREGTEEAVAAFRAGDLRAAGSAALSAYLDGFELTEGSLSVVDASLTRRVEREMMALRRTVETQGATVPEVERRAAKVLESLAEAERLLEAGSLTPGVLFASSLVILLREGMEAILILGAIGAFIIKSGHREALRYMHAGWMGALALGAATWAASTWLLDIGGATREMTEGITALFAAAMLLYVGFWMHRKLNAERWNTFLRQYVGRALEGGTLWTLTLISFVAVYREAFETVLFYQALWAQSGGGSNAILSGAGAAAALLVVAAWSIFRLGVRLPLKQFFGATAAVMISLAVIFGGKGVVALQEAGKLPSTPVDFIPRIDLLGIYPSWQTLAVQVAVITTAAGLVAYNQRGAAERS